MSSRSLPSIFVLLSSACLACSNETTTDGAAASPECADGAGCAGAGKQTCDVTKGSCVAIPPGTEIGKGDGSPASVTLTEIYTASKAAQLVDLTFDESDPPRLWVVAYGDDTVHVGTGVGAEKGTWKQYHDPAAIHFMHKPPAIAWGSSGLWGVCGDNDNGQNDPRGAGEPNYFMGPALFPSDLKIFTTQNDKTHLGSHYDMLHNTSFCRGIAHEEANIFWVFNGELGAIDKYNFNTPHEPGGDDHSDGEIYRYAVGQVKGVDGVPSHVAFDPDDKFLYVADTGNKRIVKLDTRSGTLGARLPRRNEVLKKSGMMDGTNVVEVVAPGALEQPSGLEIHNGHIYVSDTATGSFHVFDKTGKEIRKLQTGLAANSLAGFTFGKDNKVWFVDRNESKVLRIDP
jgi:outer membrane protein assembly factor BamB